MNPEISGELQFAFFSCCLLNTKATQGKILSIETEQLTKFVDQREVPFHPHRLLWRSFPVVVQEYADFVGVDPFELCPWTITTVRRFWRNYRGRSAERTVVSGMVEGIDKVSVWIAGNCVNAIVTNRYGFPISIGDTVYCRNFIIADFDRKV